MRFPACLCTHLFLIIFLLRPRQGSNVTSAGFEPATNGAEIRHSIQLNYEAIFRLLDLLDY